MKVYVAGPWKRRPEARVAAQLLRDRGFDVTARWMDVHGDSDDPTVLEQEALNDLTDLNAADVFLLLNLEVSEGKAVETGVALVEGLVMLGVGTPSNVFHHLPDFNWVPTLEEALDALDLIRSSAAVA